MCVLKQPSYEKNIFERKKVITERTLGWVKPGIWKGEGWESHRFMFAFYGILFWKRLPLMFHPSYQNGGKILSIIKPTVGRGWLKN